MSFITKLTTFRPTETLHDLKLLPSIVDKYKLKYLCIFPHNSLIKWNQFQIECPEKKATLAKIIEKNIKVLFVCQNNLDAKRKQQVFDIQGIPLVKGGRNSVFRLSSLFEKVHYPPNIDKQPELVGVVSFNFRDLLIADDAKYTSIMVPEIEPQTSIWSSLNKEQMGVKEIEK